VQSKAYDKFIKTIHRCEALVDAYKKLQELDKTNNLNIPTPKDIIRGAVVLAVASLDTYVTDAFAEKLVSHLKQNKPSNDLVNLLHKAGLDTREALSLITMERPYRRIRTLITSHYASYTTQKFDVIDSIFKPYGLAKITENAAKKSGKVSIKKSVGNLVERRHAIAHAGDYNAHGKIVDIDENKIAKRISDLELLVKNIDAILCNRIK
jgi:hypothetical protein